MSASEEISSNLDSPVNQDEKIESVVDRQTGEKKESEEVQKGSESIEMTEERTEGSYKEAVTEDKSPESMSSSTSDKTSGIEVQSELDTTSEVEAPEAAKTSASSSEPPSVSGTEGSSTSGIEGTSAMETESSPPDQPAEISPTKKSKASSFTGAIRKIISPRKKDRSHEDEVTSPKDKQKSKSFLRNPLKASKSVSPPTKAIDVSSTPAGKEETPEVNPPTISPTKAAKGGKAVSPSVTSPTKKSEKKGLGSILKSFSSMFKKTDSTEGLYMPEDAEVAAAEAAEEAASRAAQPTEEGSGTPPPFPGKPGFPYWREQRLSLDEHPPSLCETVTDEQSECSKFSDAFVPDLDSRRGSEFTDQVEGFKAAIATAALRTAAIALEATGGVGDVLPLTGDSESLASVDVSIAEDETSLDKPEVSDAAVKDKSDVPEDKPEVSDAAVKDKSDVPEDKPEVSDAAVKDKSDVPEDKPEVSDAAVKDKSDVPEDKPEVSDAAVKDKSDVPEDKPEVPDAAVKDKLDVPEDKPDLPENVDSESKRHIGDSEKVENEDGSKTQDS